MELEGLNLCSNSGELRKSTKNFQCYSMCQSRFERNITQDMNLEYMAMPTCSVVGNIDTKYLSDERENMAMKYG
jgi:hypothetical protein